MTTATVSPMSVLKPLLLILACAWVVIDLAMIRARLRSTGIVQPPQFAATLVFALGILIGALLGFSPLHLLWWWPLSAVLAWVLLMLPPSQLLIMACLGLFVGLTPLPALQQPTTRKRGNSQRENPKKRSRKLR